MPNPEPTQPQQYLVPRWPEGEFVLRALDGGWEIGPFTAEGFQQLEDGTLLYADGVSHPVILRVRGQDRDVIHANDGSIDPMDYLIEPFPAETRAADVQSEPIDHPASGRPDRSKGSSLRIETDGVDAYSFWLSTSGFVQSPSGLWEDRERQVGVAVSPAGLFVGWLDVAWPTVSEPVVLLKDVVHLPVSAQDQELPPENLNETVASARRLWDSAVRKCRYCGELFVPGYMHDHETCMGCAERQHGLVH